MATAPKALDFAEILKEGLNRNASDVHFVSGAKPMLRIAKELVALDEPPMTSAQIENLILPHATQREKDQFKKEGKLHHVVTVPMLGRFRVSLYKAKGETGAAIRVLALPIRPLEKLGLPPTCNPYLLKQTGIIFVTGATGSGKSTTLASIVDWINRGQLPKKVITIEDPIEYEHVSANGLVVQQEVGTDTPSFGDALHDALRQDPNIIVLGELRDAESILTSLRAAETGHLVLTTLHTPDAVGAVSRILASMPATQQEMVRQLLASALVMTICQELLPRADRKGLVLCPEVLVATDVVRRLIREGHQEQIYDVMQTGMAAGMLPKDISLIQLVKNGSITKETAVVRMRSPELLQANLAADKK